MTVAEKLRYLREVEGSLRGLGRPMTQQELVRSIRKEQGKSISQSYVSQIEGGVRRHMTQSTRTLLAKFFKVHPGFLVDDPEGYHTELVSDLRTTEGKLDVWLLQGSERFASDPQVSEVLIKTAREKDTRRCFLLLGAILETPGLADRLLEALQPGQISIWCVSRWDFSSACSRFSPEVCAGTCICPTFRTCTRHRLMPVRDMAGFRPAPFRRAQRMPGML
jgi:transcriptional regulator with XRE-family HTH domain